MSPETEEAKRLLEKAQEDCAVLLALAERTEIADAPLGFHAQQAVEKALKAVLASRGLDYPWSHDLQLLTRALTEAGIEVPEVVRTARRLSPWAVEFRYGEATDATLDRAWAIATVEQVLEWARGAVEAS